MSRLTVKVNQNFDGEKDSRITLLFHTLLQTEVPAIIFRKIKSIQDIAI